MIWLKRLLPFVVIGATAYGYYLWDKYQTENLVAEREKLALVTAQVWVATATYRDTPEAYLAYRDSLLAANDVSTEDLQKFLSRYESEPEHLLPFGQIVQRLVDSMVGVEDSLYREARIRAHDSATNVVDDE